MHVAKTRLLIAGAVLGASLSAQSPTTFPATVAAYGTPCPTVLSASDTVAGGQHRLDFSIKNAIPGMPVALVLGDKRVAVPLPGGCRLLANPLARIDLTADAAGAAALSLSLSGALVGDFFVQAIPYQPATGIVRASNGLALGFRGQLLVQGVAPLSAVEGDLITIRGSGFDPNPANNCVFVAGQGAMATVVSASPTKLVARVGLVASVVSGDVTVMVGQGRALPRQTLTFAGITATASGCLFTGSVGATGGVRFKLTSTSANTTAARTSPAGAAGLALHLTIPTVAKSGTVRVQPFTKLIPGHHSDVPATVVFPIGVDSAGAARWIAAYYNLTLPQHTATAAGNVVSLLSTGAPIASAGGAVSSQ